MSGSFVLGLLTGSSLSKHLSPVAKAYLAPDFAGRIRRSRHLPSETVRLLEVGQILEALSNAIVSLALGLAGATAGLAIGLAI